MNQIITIGREFGSGGRELGRRLSEALERKTGARGLRAILETMLLDVMFETPARQDIQKCIINQDVVEKKALPQLLRKEEQPRLPAPDSQDETA